MHAKATADRADSSSARPSDAYRRIPFHCSSRAVIYRKLSLGSQSEHGEQRIARLLSTHTTCRLQQRSLHAYLIDVLTAHAAGRPVPLLA